MVIAVQPFAKRLETMSLPRVLLTDNIIGRVLGSPLDILYQVKVMKAALGMFNKANKNGTVNFVR